MIKNKQKIDNIFPENKTFVILQRAQRIEAINILGRNVDIGWGAVLYK